MKYLILILISVVLPFVCGYIESVAASVDSATPLVRHEEVFIPLVAFKCGYRNQYLNKEGHWLTDNDKYATCLHGKLDILKYCRKVYPDLDVTNIVESQHTYKIDDWCKEQGTPCKWTHTVRPYQCIVGEFRSEALQVPRGCRFGHVDDRQVCEDFNHWSKVATEQCQKRKVEDQPMHVRSFAILEPCGLDLFSGVEFVCCPKGVPDPEPTKGQVTVDKVKAQVEDKKKVTVDKKDKDNDEDEDEDDEYYDDDEDDDEEYDDEDEDEATLDEEEGEDPYFRLADPDNEHQMYKEALDRLETKHRDKVAKVMREWSELDNRYQKMKEKDPKHAEEFKKEMTARFQKTVSALEEENKEQRRQIDGVHQERVQAALNERKRDAIKKYRDALAKSMDGQPLNHQVLKALQAYIRAEEKDRLHSLNRYHHLLKVDSKQAAESKHELLRRLRDIDLRINGTIAMLHDFPQMEEKVKPEIISFWVDYRKENTPHVNDESLRKVGDEALNERLLSTYEKEFENVHKEKQELDVERLKVDIEPVVVHRQPQPKEPERLRVHKKPEHHDRPAFRRQESFSHMKSVQEETVTKTSSHGGMVFAFAGLAMFVALLMAIVLIVRRKGRTQGFRQVDTCSPEEKHVSTMQFNGYENPTYRFFEKA